MSSGRYSALIAKPFSSEPVLFGTLENLSNFSSSCKSLMANIKTVLLIKMKFYAVKDKVLLRIKTVTVKLAQNWILNGKFTIQFIIKSLSEIQMGPYLPCH